MSFIGKLLRKTEPLTPAVGSTAPLDERTLAEAPDVAQELADGFPAATPADETQSLPPPAENASDTAWWEEPPPVVPSTASPASTSEPTESGNVADHDPAMVEPTPQTVEFSGLDDGTRPLSATDTPTLAALRSHRGLSAGALRDVGRVRSLNQDSLFSLLTTLPRESSDLAMGLFIVADGMGGHHGGEIASRLAISTVAQHVLAELVVPALLDGTTEALQPLIVGAVQHANRAIWDHAQSIGSDMGTTCTVALLMGRALYIGHVGDSRAYLATPTGLKLITSDHSTVGRLIQLGQLDASEAREHPLRSQLYRTIGQQPEVAVDFIYQPIGDATHLLLGSDGLWGMLGDDVLLDVLEHTIWPQDACHELIARANLAGGEDNITAIVVSIASQMNG
ncbi:MAG: protein phosphatase 2C domain-containing protein [Roseiflexaceae bacterium]